MVGRKILVVDDEDHICRVVALRLSDAGFQVTTAPDVDSALAAAAQDRPDLVITDYQMPGRTGVDLCRELHATYGDGLPSILLTARMFDLHDAEMRPANLRRIMSKPFSPRHLVATVQELLSEAA